MYLIQIIKENKVTSTYSDNSATAAQMASSLIYFDLVEHNSLDLTYLDDLSSNILFTLSKQNYYCTTCPNNIHLEITRC